MKVKQTKYSFENPEVWIPTPEESAKKEIPMLINLFKKFGKVKNVLDVGCGMGRHAYLLSKEGYVCEGVEPHPKMIEYAKQSYPSVTYKVNGMQGINYKNQFDAVVCIGSIIVFNKSNEEAMKTFKNFYNALKKDGILILETSNSISWIANQSFRKEFEVIDEPKNEKIKLGSEEEKTAYLNQLVCTNKKITTFVNEVIKNSDPKPIIILQSDEGPFTDEFEGGVGGNIDWTKLSPTALKDHLRIMNAYLLPGDAKNILYPSITPVNSFRVIFNEYFNTNLKLLPDKNYIFPDIDHPYIFIDVTKKLQED